MQPTASPRPLPHAHACLGCHDCTGLCRALVDLVAVPDAVLAHSLPR